ncbi:MAG: AsmA family protein [Woeseiaceae bacterium]|nr:AsmA family protein [Woeseiaceae bacterium]
MAKLVKLVFILAAALVGIFAVAAVAVWLFFDPNDYRDSLAAKVEEATGRELAIEGDLSLSVFPWIAIEVGRTRFGNAEGFGEEPMLSFDSARLSVELLPLIFDRTISVGTASLEGLQANLAVAADGRNNWSDIGAQDGEVAPEPADDSGVTVSVEQDFTLDIKDVVLSDAEIRYDDAQSGSRYALSNVNISTGPVAIGERFDIDGSFGFSASPAELSGDVSVEGGVTISSDFTQIDIADLSVASTVSGLVSEPADIRFDSRSMSVDTERSVIDPGELDLAALGLNVTADVEPVSWAGEPTVNAQLRVADFSLKALLDRLDIEAPATADPNALQKLSFEASAAIDARRLALSDLTLRLDDTTMTGNLTVPLNETDALTFDLRADSITVDNYMAPQSEADAEEEQVVDPEVPAELIRTLKANGTLRLDEAFVGPVRFTDMRLGVSAADDRLRLNPIAANFFEGSYSGDVRIDASGDTPVISANENISGVSIQPMLASLYEITDVTGTVNASFVVGGRGRTMSALKSDLDGSMRFELLDGTWQGVDVWHQLRSARALFKREQPPAPRTPPRTEFTSVTLSGNVTDGVMRSENLLAQLPFIRVTGGGTIDLVAAEIDYSVQARVLENPELMSVASEEELADFTQALIPIRIRGPLSSPTFRPDIEGIFRQEVERAIDRKKDELRDQLMDRLLGGEPEEDAAAGEGADTAPQKEKDLEDELKDRLREIFPR